MKSSSNKTLGALAPLLILGLCGTPVAAGVSKIGNAAAVASQVEPTDAPQRSSGTQELPTSVDQSLRNASESVIRCWQDGRLIVDERDWKTRGDDFSGPVLYSDYGRHGKLRLIQFGDTFCALKYDVRGR